MTSDANRHRPSGGLLLYYTLFTVPVLIFSAVILLLFYTSTRLANSEEPIDLATLPLHSQITQWFDPVFFQYNLALLSFAVAVVPLITYCYVNSMRQEKIRRLKRELPPGTFDDQETSDYIRDYLKKTFDMRNYFGSMMTLTFIVMFGCMIILLLKPMPLDATGVAGVDYSKGANFLMLGPYMQSYMQGNSDEYITVLISTLTAFQFGFLGAYVYFIGHLVRSYFTLDMTPNIFVSSSVRMMTGSLLALVLAYILVDPEVSAIVSVVEDNNTPDDSNSTLREILVKGLPVWSFFIGFFPSRGLIMIENISTKLLSLARVRYHATPLSDLPGMSYAHEIRMIREGYDNIENLAQANALDLALRTGFSYLQLTQWISQAHLHGYLQKDYRVFADGTGITTLDDFIDYWQTTRADTSKGDPAEELIAATRTDEHNFNEKIHVLGRLVESGKIQHASLTASAAFASAFDDNIPDNDAAT